MPALKVGVTEKKGACMKLRQQLEALEKETAAKLAEMDQSNKNMQVRLNMASVKTQFHIEHSKLHFLSRNTLILSDAP